ncbi:SPRY domain-containing SOCS box protein 3-like isoform X2 [Plodia interpunctella]|uniref:SPRY domain-containing SOCS box protein 3-like isoform X2 n=1 Tax=Plodia interpunctella TaxID=58824 RepID=UPI002367B891|nr:SPRY domain-containing SOCS box protein 3-like isoform X2 [Plodia interpunctella]
MVLMPIGPTRKSSSRDRHPKPYCSCWSTRGPVTWNNPNDCSCGEDNDVSEWKWQHPDASSSSLVVVSDDKKQVTFHPFYSSGTAVVKGDTPLQHNHHYYWEVKMLTETYGTDIMVGLGTNKVNTSDSQFEFTSFLGKDGESYGFSYTGAVKHNATVARNTTGFCRGSIIGVMVDLWQGKLVFYLNRKPQDVSFYNLRRHPDLFPMVCSTAAQSSMKLIYASSWRASLLVDAAKILAASVNGDARLRIPAGIWYTLRNNFWLTLPHGGCILDEDEEAMEVEPSRSSSSMCLKPGLGRSVRQAAA